MGKHITYPTLKYSPFRSEDEVLVRVGLFEVSFDKAA